MLSNSNAQTLAEDIPLSSDELGLPLKIISEDEVEYEVKLIEVTVAKLNELWEVFLSLGDSLSSVGQQETQQQFLARILSKDAVFLEVYLDGKIIGLLFAQNIIPGYSASFDFAFWDRQIKGRQRVILTAMNWLAEQFEINRFEFQVHSFAHYFLHRLYKIGAFYEGEKRKAWRYQDKIINLHILSILREELTEENLSLARIPRERNERRWFDLISKRG